MVLLEAKNLKIFKLKYGGKIAEREESISEAIELFSSVNIVAIYVINEKRLYNWIGNNASRALKNYIVQFRDLFRDEYPDLRVLRYITVESMAEPFDFFQSIGISKELLHQQIEKQTDKLQPVIDEINELKDKCADLFESEEFEEAITIANKVLGLAKNIDDKSLIKDQEEFIAEADLRIKTKKILAELQDEKKFLQDQLYNLDTDENIVDFHENLEEFKNKYKEYVKFTNFPEIQNVIAKEEDIWRDYIQRQEALENEAKKKQDEQERLDKLTNRFDDIKLNIGDLRKQAKKAIDKGELIEAFDLFNKILTSINEYRRSS